MGKLYKWFENFWYHYKWVTLFVIFGAAVLIIGIVQISRSDEPDIRIVYCGPDVLDGEEREKLGSAFAQIMKEDFNGDGEKTVRTTSLTVLSDEQLQEKIDEAAQENDTIYYDPTSRKETIRQLSTLLGTGECIICLLDDYVYLPLAEQQAFASLEGILGYTPDFAADEYSVRIKDLPFAQYFGAFSALDENTRFCIRNISENALIGNKKTSEKEYGWHKELFCSVFEFKLP